MAILTTLTENIQGLSLSFTNYFLIYEYLYFDPNGESCDLCLGESMTSACLFFTYG